MKLLMPRRPGARCFIALKLLLALLFMGGWVLGSEPPLMTEKQVKALFLVNFAKYVDWPSDSLAAGNDSFVIGLFGECKLADDLAKAVVGRTVSGHGIRIQQVRNQDEARACRIVFISHAEKKRLVELLEQVRGLPVLTVGETDEFCQLGGIITFIKKDDKVRLQIELDAARRAGLEISSRLLSVADRVNGGKH